jgi:hypothetical protein
MCDWNSVRAHIASNFAVAYEAPGEIFVDIDFQGGRRQRVVIVYSGELGGGTYASVRSTVCYEEQIDPVDGLARSAEMWLGTLGSVAFQDADRQAVWWRQAVRLNDVGPDAVDEVMQTVALLADGLEQELTNQDTW